MAKLDREHRRLARGTDEATPVRALLGVGAVVAIGVGVLLLVTILIWIFLR